MIAAALTALMILLFLGSWRSTLIVCVSIPLSIATSLIVLTALGQTINVMTLGGLALAVGILVDDATVEIETTHRNMALKKPLTRAILDSAQQVAAPAFVSTLSICIVFVPVVLLTGAAKFLFTPLAMAVAFAMLASYFLSRTLVPTMMHFLLGKELALYQSPGESDLEEKRNFVWRWHMMFDRKFERLQHHYKRLLEWCLNNPAITLLLFALLLVVSTPLTFFIGRDFFPYVDSGQMRLEVEPPQGLRIEDAEQYFANVDREIRRVLPPARVQMIIDNIGLPNSGINLAFSNAATVSNTDGEILISLTPGRKQTQEYMRMLRDDLHQKFPDATFFFAAANITNQILDFGLPAPIDLQVIGRGKGNFELATKLAKQIAEIVGTTNSVPAVAKIRPPITARPSGAFCSPPSPSASAMALAEPRIIHRVWVGEGPREPLTFGEFGIGQLALPAFVVRIMHAVGHLGGLLLRVRVRLRILALVVLLFDLACVVDGRMRFEETNSSRKKKPAIAERVHKPANRRMLWIFVLCFAVLFLIVVLVGWLPRRERNKDIDRRAEQQRDAKPVVEAARVERAKSQAGLVLPGTTLPLTEAYVYARANGYLKRRLVDIGDHVRKNQLLAIIEAPDLDQQVAQAKQQLAQIEQQLEQQRSQLALALVTVQRYRVLVAKGVLSRQDGDQQEANYASQVANVAAAQRNVDAFRANLRRVQALQAFEYVRAPFAGVITQRNADVGALISAAGVSSGEQSSPAPQGQISSAGGTQQAAQSNNAGSSGATSSAANSAQSPGQGGPLFGISQTRRLRILVSVPEGYARSIHAGGHAQLAFREYPGTNFAGQITRTADSVDPNTRTMLAEVQIDNHSNKLVPGMYTVVTFPPAPGIDGPLLVTGDAIVIRHDQMTVAKVENGKVQIVPVTIGRDFGAEVELLTGVQPGDVIVTNVTDEVVDGAPVQLRLAQTPEQQPQQPPSQKVPAGGSTRYSNQGLTDQKLQGRPGQENQKSQQNGKAPQNKNSKSESKP